MKFSSNFAFDDITHITNIQFCCCNANKVSMSNFVNQVKIK